MISLLRLMLIFPFLGTPIQSAQEKLRQREQVHELVPGRRDVVDCFSSEINTQIPSIYCYDGKRREFKFFWETVSISVKLNNDLFELFEGESPSVVMEKFRLHQSSWSANLLSFRKRKLINLNPFNRTCIGILTSKSYSVHLIVNEIDSSQFFKFVVGLFLFFYAKKLCHNQIFYYLCGVTLGICGSVIILIYLISRIFPNKTLTYSFAFGGSTLVYYFVHYLFDNAKLIALQYKEYVLSYIALSGLISFALCYRFGPMTNPRTKNLIQWSLQFAGLIFIFYSSYLNEVTYTLDMVLVLSRVVPFDLIVRGFRFVRRKLFRPKIKLLTEKEYDEQGREETRKALTELRGYCSSPECDPWKMVLKLKNPRRFAEFIEGSPHLSEDEIEQYGGLGIKVNGTIVTDDSDSIAELSENETPLRSRLGKSSRFNFDDRILASKKTTVL